MQANVILILQAAKATENFEAIRDRYLRDPDGYPALVVASRTKVPDPQNTAYTAYKGPWEYEVLIFREEDDEFADDPDQGGADWVDLEAMTKEFLDEILGDGSWEITDGPDYGNVTVMSGAELIGARIVLQRHQVDRYNQ